MDRQPVWDSFPNDFSAFWPASGNSSAPLYEAAPPEEAFASPEAPMYQYGGFTNDPELAFFNEAAGSPYGKATAYQDRENQAAQPNPYDPYPAYNTAYGAEAAPGAPTYQEWENQAAQPNPYDPYPAYNTAYGAELAPDAPIYQDWENQAAQPNPYDPYPAYNTAYGAEAAPGAPAYQDWENQAAQPNPYDPYRAYNTAYGAEAALGAPAYQDRENQAAQPNPYDPYPAYNMAYGAEAALGAPAYQDWENQAAQPNPNPVSAHITADHEETPEQPAQPAHPSSRAASRKANPFAWVLMVHPIYWALVAVILLLAAVFSVPMLKELSGRDTVNERVNAMFQESQESAESARADASVALAAAASTAPEPENGYSTTSRTRVEAYPQNPFKEYSTYISSLQASNTDALGAFAIPGLVETTVYQSTGDAYYYQSHDGSRRESSGGAAYFGKTVSFDNPPENITLYGLASGENPVFGVISQLSSSMELLAASAARVELLTPYEDGTYILFAVFPSSTDSSSPSYFSLNNETSFATDAAMMDFVMKAKEHSSVSLPVEVQPGDRLLTVTALSAYNGRPVILVYRLARDGET